MNNKEDITRWYSITIGDMYVIRAKASNLFREPCLGLTEKEFKCNSVEAMSIVEELSKNHVPFIITRHKTQTVTSTTRTMITPLELGDDRQEEIDEKHT